MDEGIREYRNNLALSRHKMSDDYDKIVITLSGGALGLSFFFIRDVISQTVENAWWLVGAWAMWTLSLICLGLALIFSQKSLEKAMEQVDEAIEKNDVNSIPHAPGGWFRKVTDILNYSAGVLFVLGVVSIAYFVIRNMG